MGSRIRMSTAVWLLTGLAMLTGPALGQTTPPIQNGQVEIFGSLPRTTSGEVNVEALKQTIETQFARPGVQEVQFRNVSLTDAEQRVLFLNGDPDKNLLRQIADIVPSPNGAERHVTFRSDEFRARVGREEGQLRARVEGVDQSQLSDQERQNLRAQFDRLRLEGANDRGGNQDGNRGSHGRSDNSGPGSANSGRGSGNSGPGSVNSGSGHGGGDNRGSGSANSGHGRQDDVRNVNDDRREDRRQDRQMDRRDDRREDRQLDRRDDRREDRQADRQMDRREDRQQDRIAGDRPDRPDRPEQPDRSDRSGHN